MNQTDPIKILIVDDLPEKMLVYRSVLEEPGIEIVAARSGAEALGQVLAHDFAVILLDVEMPAMDGFEAATLIRTRKRSAYTPIIFVTAHADELHTLRGYASGAVDYILTPVMPEILRTKVRVFVDLFRLNRQVKAQAEWQLAQARGEQARLAAVLENAADFVGQTDPGGRILYVNGAGRRMIGRADRDPLPTTLASIQPPWAAKVVSTQGFPAAVRDGVWIGEAALIDAAGAEIPVSQVILAFKNSRGEVESFSLIASDIRERKEAEIALGRSERRYRQLVHAMPAAVYTCDAQGRLTLFNQAAVALWGREPELKKDDWYGMGRVCRPDGTPLRYDECPMAIALREGQPVRGVEVMIERADGTRSHILPHPEPIFNDQGQIIGGIDMLVDITERKRADEARSLLASIVDSTDDVVISLSLDGTVTSFNRAAESLFGYTADQMIGRSITLLIPSERRNEEEDILNRIRRGESVEHFETVRVTRAGRRIEVSLTVSPVRDGQGQIIGASKIARDITERHRAEAALHESESRLRAMFGQAAVGIVLVDLWGRILEANGRMSQIVGRSPSDLCSLTFEELAHPEDLAEHKEILEEVARGERSDCAVECRCARHDRSWVWVNVTVSPLLDGRGGVHRLMLVVEDISARKLAELEIRQHRQHLETLVQERTAELRATHERLRLSDRLASIGTLAAGLGHDMGNLLLPLRMRLESLETLPLPEEGGQEIAGIRTSVEYLQRLANGLRLLVLEPKRAGSRGIVELHTWWKDVLPLLRNAVGQSISIFSEFPDEECWIRMDPTSLTQIVFNLAQNAGNAMKERGSGTIRIGVDRVQAGWRLRVIDDGPGMSDEVRRRCMEPFYTTRPREMSTGLGLVLVYGLIRQVDGAIEIQSTPGVGTSFFVTLPEAHVAPASNTHARPIASIAIRDERLRALVAAELDRLEFEVRADSPGKSTNVLVTDERDDGAVQRLAVEQPERLIAVIGAGPASPTSGQIMASGPSPNTSEVRELLKRVSIAVESAERPLAQR